MLKNYFKVSLRYLLRYKEYTAINILGLAVGITCCLLIMLFVRSELSYDRFHSKSDRIFRAWQHEKADGHDFVNVLTPLPMAAAMQSSFAEIQSACRVYNFNMLVKPGNNAFSENINMVDSGFFRIFDFKLVAGNPSKPFPTANSVILTPLIAQKFFGSDNPLGKNIEMQLGDKTLLFTVSGVIQPSPAESSIKYDLLIPFDNAKYLFRERAFHSWTNIFTETYVLLKEGVSPIVLEKKFPSMVKQQFGEDYKEGAYQAFLQPITDIHLNAALPEGNLPISNPKYSYILSSIGILILLLACVNFITLSVGRSGARALEVGVRKVLGAERRQIIRQFWGEAFLVTIIAVIIGLVLAMLLISPFNQLTEKALVFRFDGIFVAFFSLLIGLIAILAGIYPAIILSGFNPIEVLKGKLKLGNRGGLFRQSLIIGQFVIAISMIACTFLVSRQMGYLEKKDLGYVKDQVVIIETNKKMSDGFDLAKKYSNELQKYPWVEASTTSVFSFSEIPWATLGYTDDKKIYRNFQFNVIDPNFLPALHIPLAEGRNFSANNTSDKYGSILVNEAMVKEYGWKEPIGKKLPGPYGERIIGVMKDFNYESLHTKIKPLLFALSPDSILSHSEDVSFSNAPQPRISVRLKPGNLSANMHTLKMAWLAIAPNQEFEFHFLDQRIADLYKQEKRTEVIIRLSSVLSIFIACMGLFGLATLTVVQRTKEIGIRKVLGASIGGIVSLLSKDFIRPIAIAVAIAFPVSWWAMNNWLNNFAYHTDVSWWLLLVAGAVALMIAGITVSVQSIRAALNNPALSLRTE